MESLSCDQYYGCPAETNFEDLDPVTTMGVRAHKSWILKCRAAPSLKKKKQGGTILLYLLNVALHFILISRVIELAATQL